MKKFLSIFFLLSTFCIYSFAETISLHKDSKLYILGTSNLVNFSLAQKGSEIQGKDFHIVFTKNQNSFVPSQNKLVIKVKNFKSTNLGAQAEFYRMMEIEKFPALTIELNYFEKKSLKSSILSGTAHTTITIKGIGRNYEIPLEIKQDNHTLHIKGEKKLSIRDFNIEPPTALMGLIRVNEWITIRFDLLCETH